MLGWGFNKPRDEEKAFILMQRQETRSNTEAEGKGT